MFKQQAARCKCERCGGRKALSSSCPLEHYADGRLGGCIETTMEYILAWTDEWTDDGGG